MNLIFPQISHIMEADSFLAGTAFDGSHGRKAVEKPSEYFLLVPHRGV